ncbi:MAG: hypothetical protein JW751_11460 [Polyangiaceae bacterium]|nr:hypothetical protein [Polyangiaceae bacterium]
MATTRSAWLGAVLAGCALFALTGGAWAGTPGSGDLDTGFGGAGFVAVQGDTDGAVVRAMAVDSMNRVVAVGRDGDRWPVLRFNTDGTLDATFGSGGKVYLFDGSAGSQEGAYDVAVDAQDRILVVGAYGVTSPTDYRLTLVRLTPAGARDTTFGSAGIVQVAIDKGAIAKAVKIQSDGRVVVAGTCRNKQGYWSFLVARFLTDGTLDKTFGTATKKGRLGYLIDDFNSKKSEGVYEGVLAVQPDGRILIGGFTNGPQSHWYAQGWTVIRYLPNGARDTSFGAQGVVTATPSCDLDYWTVGGLAVQVIGSDSYILASGRGWDSAVGPDPSMDGVVIRYTSAGVLDTSFGTAGLARTGLAGEDQARQIAVDSSQRIVLGGQWKSPAAKFAFRFLPSGLADASFCHEGTNGLSALASMPSSAYENASCLTRDHDGKILVGGASLCNSTRYFSMARFMP